MENKERFVEYVTNKIVDLLTELENNPYMVPVGISARHVHLTHEAISILFGRNTTLSIKKQLSQTGQFAANEQVQLVGPKGTISNVRVLGPERSECQVEISYSDARKLGVNGMVRASGDLHGTPGIRLVGPVGSIDLESGVIIAKRHVHMNPMDAKWFGVEDGQKVTMIVTGPKSGIMQEVTVRVHTTFRLEYHIDIDDSNAFFLQQGSKVRLTKHQFIE